MKRCPSSGKISIMDENDDSAETLKGLVFPKLRSLQLFVDFGHEYIPRIQGHRIEELDVDSRHEAYPITTVDADATGAILEQIPVVFPDVRNMVFSDLAPVSRGAPQRLAAQLPRLEKYDHRYLHEVKQRRLQPYHMRIASGEMGSNGPQALYFVEHPGQHLL